MQIFKAEFDPSMNDHLKWLIINAALSGDRELFDHLVNSSCSQLPENICDAKFPVDFLKNISSITLILNEVA